MKLADPLLPSLTLLTCYALVSQAIPVPSAKSTSTNANGTTFILPTTVVHEFPRDSWIENLVVRKNGQILATQTIPYPRIWQVDPFGTRGPILVHQFNDTASVEGIVETEPDVFYVASANLSSNYEQSYGQAYIFKLGMRSFMPEEPSSAKISRIADLSSKAGALNGLGWLGEGTNTLVCADTLRGLIWSIDMRTGESTVAINNTYTQPMGTAINGLKVREKQIYFTNSIQNLLAKVPINGTGHATGPTTILSKGGFMPDDFVLSMDGDAYVASFTEGLNGIVFVPGQGGKAIPIAGAAGPTSAAFGRTRRDCHTLYISSSGGADAYAEGRGNTVAGKISKVEVGRQGMYGCRGECWEE